jgi:hypothetical protein
MAALMSATSGTPKSLTFFCTRGSGAEGEELAATVLPLVGLALVGASAAFKKLCRQTTAKRKAAAATAVTATLPGRELKRRRSIPEPLHKVVTEFARIRPHDKSHRILTPHPNEKRARAFKICPRTNEYGVVPLRSSPPRLPSDTSDPKPDTIQPGKKSLKFFSPRFSNPRRSPKQDRKAVSN